MTHFVRATVLGCGSSGGVPRANGDWGECDPTNPKNRRRRCSLLVEQAASQYELDAGNDVTRVVIDVSPDFREQMLSAEVRRIDGVLITHDHADQTHGMDDLRAFAMSQKNRIPVWMDDVTAQTLLVRFGYAFSAQPNSPYPAILDRRIIDETLSSIDIDGPGGTIHFTPYIQQHGWITSLGFRFADLAYSADVSGIEQASLDQLDGLQCWIIDALRQERHPSHFSVSDALETLKKVNCQTGILTNLHIPLDYHQLSASLPDNVRCAFDGIQVTQGPKSLIFSER
jgi:phosphoribosyl 1,2-cyclic phosphate phosphodiesterase